MPFETLDRPYTKAETGTISPAWPVLRPAELHTSQAKGINTSDQ